MRPHRRSAATCLVVLLATTAAGCSAERPAPAAGPTAVPEPSPAVVVTPTPSGAPPGPGAPVAPTSAPVDPLQGLPAGPATPEPAPPPAEPGDLGSVSWSTAVHEGVCVDARSEEAQLADLDGDGTREAAVPVECGEVDHVVVYGGDAGRPERLGEVLSSEEPLGYHSVSFRDGHLVVTGIAPRPGEDVAVTTRWRLLDGALTRVDRWEDPASILVVDEDH